MLIKRTQHTLNYSVTNRHYDPDVLHDFYSEKYQTIIYNQQRIEFIYVLCWIHF